MRKPALLLLLAGAGFAMLQGAKASKKSIALEQRYNANFQATWTVLNAHETTLAPITASGNSAFLAGLSQLPTQSDENSTLTGVCNWANNHTDYLFEHGFMAG